MNLGLRIGVFAALLAIVNLLVGGVWGVILGLSAAFVGTVFLHSYVNERRAKAAAGPSDEATPRLQSPFELRLLEAHRTLNRARLSFLLMIGVFFLPGFVGKQYAIYCAAGYVALFFVFHALLGRAAVLAGRSWVTFGLLPLVLPGVGGLFSFGVLRHKVPHPD